MRQYSRFCAWTLPPPMHGLDAITHLTPDQRVIDYFNQCAHSYGDAYRARSLDGHFYRRRQEIILPLLGRIDGGALLDVGCGPGLMAQPCLERGFTFTGVDISEAMIAECQEKFGGRNAANFLVGKLQNLPFPSDLFDVVLCMGALEYVAPTEESTALSEISRVTRSGGFVIISCLNKWSPYWMLHRHMYVRARRYSAIMSKTLVQLRLKGQVAEEQDDGARVFSDELFRRSLERCGFSIVETSFYGFNILPRPLDSKFPGLASLASEKLESLSGGRLRWLAMGFIITARKQLDRGPATLQPQPAMADR